MSLKKLIESNTGLSDGLVSIKEKLSHLVKEYAHNSIKFEKETGLLLEKSLPQIFQTVLVKDNSDLLDFLDKIEENQIQKVSLLSEDYVCELSTSQISKKEMILKKYKAFCPTKNILSSASQALSKIVDRILIFRDDLDLFECLEKEGIQNECFILISERGTLFQNGFISCGEDSEFTQSIVSQKFEIEKLSEEKSRLEEELAKFENNFVKQRNSLIDIEKELKIILEALQEDKILETKHATLLESLILEKEKYSSEMTLLKKNLEENTKTIEILKEDLLKQNQKGSLLEKEKFKINVDLEDLEAQFSYEKERSTELSNEMAKIKEERAIYSERIENLHRSYEESLKHSKFLDDNLKKYLNLSEKLSKEMDDSANNLKSLQVEINAIIERATGLEKDIKNMNDNGDSLFEKMNVLKTKLENSSAQNSGHKNIIEEKNLELARYDTILEASFKEAQERFHLSQEDFDKIEESDEDEKALQKDIQGFKIKVESIGPVNENAIEEFKSIQERFTFLKEQKEDITLSIHELRKSIETIVETTKKHFLEHLKKVNFEFQNIFPILFPQGHGELSLSNAEDILNSGVEIEVKLPGKRLKNMKLFSGGEKALTAISLILSLLKTQPTPFCFLDEVDAPLDEANIGRFNKVLEILGDQFQFIVITHNRRTMEILDTIYGISMKQAGISSMVSVDLTDAPDYLKKKNFKETKSGAIAN
jgi:chromosome segregation protein